MKKNVLDLFPVYAFVLLSCSCNNSSENSIRGRFDHAGERTLYLARVTQMGEKTIDSTITDQTGRFEFANPADSTDFFILRSDDENLIYLVLKKGEGVELSGDARKLEATYEVKGSKDSELLHYFRKTDRKTIDSCSDVYESWRERSPLKSDSIGAVLQVAYTDRMREVSIEIVKKNPTSLVSLSATKFLDQNEDLGLMQTLLDSLLQKYPGNPYVSDYASLIASMKLLPAGSLAPPIVLESPEGKMISLSDFKGKVVLVDFWASWCGPCRLANPELVRIYNKYKGPNFEILGVSLDQNEEAWTAAIKQDRLTWAQVSELKRWDSKCVKDYMIDAIPFSVLVDEEGKIIAKGLQPEQLEPTLLVALKKIQ